MDVGRLASDGLYCGNAKSYEAVVVGSGYGGSVAACRLSEAGFKVCLLEKGRRWEAHEFPKDIFRLVSASKMECKMFGFDFGFGSEQALFQIHDQGDSLAAVACGLGGGSLVNAGVLVPTPVRARRDTRWPEEWRKDWEVHERRASAMLGAQSVPVEFPNARVMQQIADELEIEECRPDPIKLSINFGRGSEGGNSCLACGNCLSGCPYNAKNSTDKNYLASAIQDGCVVKTERKVLYILENPGLIFEKINGITQQKRWRVYLDDLEYISADFVVLSAGVLGTSEILFQSAKRGLNVSKRLGLGLSCNGNNVAYVAGSKAPLHAHGLDREQILSIPFQRRPGPTISSSYTSSLGFTIQSGVIPGSYPYLLFKGITTYGWPRGSWFVHGLIDKLKHFMGLTVGQDIVLNVMGYDASDGTIKFDEETEKMRITPPNDPVLPKKIQAFRKLAERLGGILFMSRYRSTSVHLLGGCNAASNPSDGVCNPNGQVFGPVEDQIVTHEGLYVCDGSLVPCSVGINPCLTISTIAEHVSRNLVQDVARYLKISQDNDSKSSSTGDERLDDGLIIQGNKSIKIVDDYDHKMNGIENPVTRHQDHTVTMKETMRGLVGGMQCTTHLVIKMNLGGQDNCTTHGLKGRVCGYVVFPAINKDKLFIVDGSVDMCSSNTRTPYTQYMHYRLVLVAAYGSRYILEGRKIMNPYLLASYALRESTTMHVIFAELVPPSDHTAFKNSSSLNDKPILRGELHIPIIEILKSFITLKGEQRGYFVFLLLRSLWRTYILQVPCLEEENLTNLVNFTDNSYPVSTLHGLVTDDGHEISCRQWKSCARNCEEETHRYPVLLLNGHSTESYCLPSEQNDLVRTLLEEGHETWLLQSRLHPLHPSNDFTIDDIGRFDIPTVIKRILELNGVHTKIHVIAHCVGGLAIHIAILGGHISASNVASISCTNSSMFFKITTSALFKMRLPLIPVTMAILGKNRILSMYAGKEEEGYRHKLVKLMARVLPRDERCACEVCEVFSGIFGNTFWHENVGGTTHKWLLSEHSLPKLPMSAFPHLRRICTAGFVVDSRGRNEYLVHPERMAVPTLYLSGGRSLLVMPETSALANEYMKLHQPGFVHRRVVVEGFGHSDLLIGEESCKKVFPHFISHMRLVEGGGGRKEEVGSRESVLWDHGSQDGGGSWGGLLFTNILILFSSIFIFYFLT